MKKQNTAIGNRRVTEQTRIHEGRWHYKVFQNSAATYVDVSSVPVFKHALKLGRLLLAWTCK